MNTSDLLSALAGINEADVAAARHTEIIRREFRRAKYRRIACAVSACLCVIAVTLTVFAVRNYRISKLPKTAASASPMPELATEPAAMGETAAAFNGTYQSPAPSAGAYTVTVPDHTAAAQAGTTAGYSPPYAPAVTAAAPQTAVNETGVPMTGTAPENAYDGSGGVYGGVMIPVIPASGPVVETGQRITDAEAAEYFRRTPSVLNSLAASGVPTDGAVISPKGYCHVCYYGKEGEKPEVKLNFRDYLVRSGGKLVSIITLYRVDGQIYSSPAFGGPWFDGFNDFLNAHAGQELLFVYAGSGELIFTPDGAAHSPLGLNTADYTGGRTDLYRLFYHPDAVFVP